ncbi:hypothetical protein SB748_33475, partial [Rhizobium sp. SIMBA_035]
PFDAAQLIDGLRQRLSGELGVPRDAFERMCLLLQRVPDVAGDALREVGGIPLERRETSSVTSVVEADRASTTAGPSEPSGEGAGKHP